MSYRGYYIQLVGIRTGDISLGSIEKSFQALNIDNNEGVVFVDQNGKKVAD